MSAIRDHRGKVSGKRVAGFALLFVGAALRVFVVIMAYLSPEASATVSTTVLGASEPFFLYGAALIGLSVAELFDKGPKT